MKQENQTLVLDQRGRNLRLPFDTNLAPALHTTPPKPSHQKENNTAHRESIDHACKESFSSMSEQLLL
jgi:hypothetical protein